jgi:ATP-binding protein involved in chromosome partitioning
MKIAIPTMGAMLCPHFGHCEEFTLVTIDPATKQIVETESIPAPAHEPGLLPRWLHEKGADIIIAGGMGVRAQDLFMQSGVKVCVGAPVASPSEIVNAYLDGTLESGTNLCDH